MIAGSLQRPARLPRALAATLVVLCVGCATPGSPSRPASGPGSLPPTADTDQDGVANEADDCPASRVTVGIAADGCTPFEGPLANVDFAPGRATLGAEARSALDELTTALSREPGVRLEVQGHTDNRGSAADNLALSKRRVMAVVRYLVTNGVAPDRLEPWGYGENRPIAGNATAAGRASNRRIEVRALVP